VVAVAAGHPGRPGGLADRPLPARRGGHSPADGFKAAGAPSPVELPGIAIAALATLGLGAVLGPEAPLIALGARSGRLGRAAGQAGRAGRGDGGRRRGRQLRDITPTAQVARVAVMIQMLGDLVVSGWSCG
jgi:hypothetical protein